MRPKPSTRGRQAFTLTVLALLWSICLLIAALTIPAYGSATLVDENGTWVLLVVAIPAVISAGVWFALWRKCTHGRQISGYIAWGGVWAIAAFCLLAIASIGLFVIPVALLLGSAASRTPAGSPEPPATNAAAGA